MKFTKSLLAVAILSACSMSSVYAASGIPDNWENGIPIEIITNAGTDLTFSGDGSDVIVMTRDESNTSVHPESPVMNWVGHKLTIDNIKSLTIAGDPNSWNSGIYTNSQSSSAISIAASDSISVAGASMAVHALDGQISLKAKNVTLNGGNAIVAQVDGKVQIEASESLTITSTSTSVYSQSFGVAGNHEVVLSAPVVSIVSEGGKAIGTDSTGLAKIVADEAVLTGTTGISSAGGDVVLSGGNFTVTGTSGTAIQMTDDGSFTLDAKTLTANGSIDAADSSVVVTSDNAKIISNGENSTIKIKNLSGNDIQFELDHIVSGEEPTVKIDNNQLNNTNVAFTAAAVDGFASPEEMTDALKAAVSLSTDGSAAGTVTGNGTSYTVSVDAVTGESSTIASDITKSSLDMAAMTLVAWRNETTTLTDRMSTLRSNPDQYGAWARWNGGEYKFDDRNLSNKFNTIEVGADTRIGNGPWTVGASLAYTKGEGDFVNGESDTDAYTGALYALWSHESGSFVDMMMKTGRINSDYDFFNEVGGGRDAASFKQTGFIMGVETGHRFALSDMVFVEPQLQLTYSRLAGIHETTAARTIDMEASDSLVGRIGVMAGVKCPNNVGDAYVRVSALRDFRGDVDGTFSGYKASQELDQNWVEFAVGANFKLADNFYTFVDVQKSTGGDIELDWRANVGAKMFF